MTVTPLPGDIGYAYLDGFIFGASADGSHSTPPYPDATQLVGATVTFTAAAPYVLDASAHAVMIPQPVTCQVSDGSGSVAKFRLIDPEGNAGVYLAVGGNPAQWGWNVLIQAPGIPIIRGSLPLLTAGETYYLNQIVPVPAAAGTPSVVGPAPIWGDPTLSFETTDDDSTITMTGTGSLADPYILHLSFGLETAPFDPAGTAAGLVETETTRAESAEGALRDLSDPAFAAALSGTFVSWGPVASGSDDTTALNTVLAAPGVVMLRPFTTYHISGTLDWDPSVTAVVGYQTRIIYSGTATALNIQGSQAALSAGAALNTSSWRGVELIGPGPTTTAVAVSVSGTGSPGTTVNLNFRDSSVHGFGTAILQGSYAWTCAFEGLAAWNNGVCIYDDVSATGGERMLYFNCNLSNNGTLVSGVGNGTTSGAQSEHIFIGCSLDFNQILAVIFNGMVTQTDSHVEYASSSVSPIQLNSSYSVFRMKGGAWVTHTDFGLAAALTSGVAITSIPVSITANQPTVTAGDTIVVASGVGGTSDTFTATGPVSGGAIPVSSKAPTHSYAIGAKVADQTQMPATVVSSPSSMSNGAGAYFDKVPMQGIWTTSGGFGPGGQLNYSSWVSPNMAAPSYCLTLSGTSSLAMGAAFPTVDTSGVFISTAKTQTVSAATTLTLNPSTEQQIYITVTTTAAWTLQFGSGESPAQYRTQDFDIIIYNNSGGTLGTITFPSWVNDTGLTWTNPAAGKRRRVTVRYLPSAGQWLIVGMSAADF